MYVCCCLFISALVDSKTHKAKSMSSREKVDLKVVLLGDSGVGKTCLLVRFLDDSFGNTTSTIGASYFKKTVLHNQNSYALGLWDTAGQERYDSLSSFYCRGAGAAIIVFDLTSKESFVNITKWVTKLQTSSPEANCFIILVGTKLDSVKFDGIERQVTEADGNDYAKKIGAIKYIEASSKTGENVKDVFTAIVEKLSSVAPKSPQASNDTIDVSKSASPAERKGGCC